MHAFLYRDDGMHDLGTLPGGRNSIARSINNRGQIAGTSTVTDGNSHAFLYENGQMTDLAALPGGTNFSDAKSINDRGQILGVGVLFDNGKFISISLPNSLGQVTFAFAAAINDSGEIAGVLLPDYHAAVLNSDLLTDEHP